MFISYCTESRCLRGCCQLAALSSFRSLVAFAASPPGRQRGWYPLDFPPSRYSTPSDAWCDSFSSSSSSSSSSFRPRGSSRHPKQSRIVAIHYTPSHHYHPHDTSGVAQSAVFTPFPPHRIQTTRILSITSRHTTHVMRDHKRLPNGVAFAAERIVLSLSREHAATISSP